MEHTCRSPRRHRPVTVPLAAQPWAVLAASLVVLLAAGLLSSCTEDDAADSSDGGATTSGGSVEDLRLNEVQVVGSHNSYHLPAPPEVASALEALVPSLWETISYSHLPLTQQLDEYGIRQFELDVFPDPEGGLLATPAGHELVGIDPPADPALSEPGFKVAHTADIDQESTCVTFVACLTEIEEWSSAHPDHLPLMVMVETKGDDLRAGAGDLGVDLDSLGVEFVSPPQMTPELFDELDAEILSVFGRERILTPDDVRGDADTLEEAVLGQGWPTLAETRGKVLFALVDTGANREVYVEGAPSLEGRVMFTSSEAGRADAAFLRIDDPSADAELLAEMADAGYLIRTRTDSPGVHAPAGDTSWLDPALASGAHYLSTDYYVPHADTGFVVQLPGRAVARCNPATAPSWCDDGDLAAG